MTEATHAPDLARRHLRIGWWALLAFATLGITLEVLHGLKIGFYLDVGNKTRRLMWTLAHAHGTLIAVLNLAFAGTVRIARDGSPGSRTLASRCLLGALILMPLGFLLGGVFTYGGDPGIGIYLVPPGALLLFVAILSTARSL